jgi:hypothetical protein
MQRKALWIVTITALHAALTMGAVLVTMTLGMSAFEGKRASGVADSFGGVLAQVLMAPVGPVYRALVPRVVQALPFAGNVAILLNSLLWAIAIVWFVERRVNSPKTATS